MAKTANDLARELKECIIDLQSDAHNRGSINKYRYNNLKLEVLDPRANRIPQVKITIGISEAVFNIKNGEKASGGLGPDERYVLRWFMKNSVLMELKDLWQRAEVQQGSSKSEDGKKK